MSNLNHLTCRALSQRNLRRGARRRTYVGIVVATSMLCGSGAAHSGPCAVQIAQLERQIQLAASSPASGPTAPQSVTGLLHRQPTPDMVRNAERKANLDAAVALDRARQADVDGSAVACAKALDEAKHHWVIPPLS